MQVIEWDTRARTSTERVTEIAQFSRRFPDTAKVAGVMKNKLDKFRDYLPLIKCITSEAISEEDWGEIKVACNNESMDRD